MKEQIPLIHTEYHTIEHGLAPYLIAEIGLNHNGDVQLAGKMIEAAASSGAQGVKFQIYDTDHFISRKASLGDDGQPGSLAQFFRQFELSRADYTHLRELARKHGVDFLASVFDAPSLELYLSLDPSLIKLASSEITNHELYEQVSRSGLPVIFATGASTEQEVAAAYHAIARTDTVILQCVSAYPADPAQYNLRLLEQWRGRYTPLVGLSDHTTGLSTSLAATALGAVVIERHFTLDRNSKGPDQALSLEPSDLQQLAAGVRGIHSALGRGTKHVEPSEEAVRMLGRRGLYAKRDLPEGYTFTEDSLQKDVQALRPGGGLPVAELRTLPGRTTVRSIAEGQLLVHDDFVY